MKNYFYTLSAVALLTLAPAVGLQAADNEDRSEQQYTNTLNSLIDRTVRQYQENYQKDAAYEQLSKWANAYTAVLRGEADEDTATSMADIALIDLLHAHATDVSAAAQKAGSLVALLRDNATQSDATLFKELIEDLDEILGDLKDDGIEALFFDEDLYEEYKEHTA